MERERLWTPGFLGMGGSNLFLFMSQYIMVAALPIFIMDTLSGGDMEAGMAMTAFQIGAVVCRPFAGRLIDAVDKQRLMRAATIGFFFVMLAFFWFHSLQAMFALRLLHGCIFAVATTAAAAMAALILPASRKGGGHWLFCAVDESGDGGRPAGGIAADRASWQSGAVPFRGGTGIFRLWRHSDFYSALCQEFGAAGGDELVLFGVCAGHYSDTAGHRPPF